MTVVTSEGRRYVLDRKPIIFNRRSLEFPARTTGTHRPVNHRIYGPVLDQGQIGACVLHAGAHDLNGKPLHVAGKRLLNHNDALTDYHDTTVLDPYPGQWPETDDGTDADSAAKNYRNKGRIAEWRHAQTLDQIVGELQLGNNVMLGISWHQSMFKPDADGTVHPDGKKVGGHEVLIKGDNALDRGREKFRLRNSWGAHFGVNGDFFLSYADLDTLMGDQGDAIVLLREAA